MIRLTAYIITGLVAVGLLTLWAILSEANTIKALTGISAALCVRWTLEKITDYLQVRKQ